MSSSIYIFREKAGFTLYCNEIGRMEVGNALISEDYAVTMFSEFMASPSPKIIPLEEIPDNVVFEGIETIAVKNGKNISYQSVKEVFSSAIKIMVEEANEQEKVFGYIPIMSQSGNWMKADFERFFLSQLKSTKENPERFIFPEFSIAHPILSSTASIGETSERMWGIIQDKRQLIAIKNQILSSLLLLFGDLPTKRFVDNYYLSI